MRNVPAVLWILCLVLTACPDKTPDGECGDGVLDAFEECDDGNAVTEGCAYGDPGCTVCAADCTMQPGAATFCGDGVVSGTEACDDGNAVTEVCAYGVAS